MSEAWIELEKIHPYSIVYYFSGGKDSSAALALSRDVVREYSKKYHVKVYIFYVYIPGNTHPANAYAAYTVMMWHKSNYGFEPVTWHSSKFFPEYVARYGLQKGPQRWCFLEFKEKGFRKFHRKLPKPVLYIDGMKPSDSKIREKQITSEFQLIKSYRGKYWSWHPLYRLTNDDVFKILEQHKEFNQILDLYRIFGNSVNCVLCPYRSPKKMMYNWRIILYSFLDYVLKSKTFKASFRFLLNTQLGMADG